MSKATTAIVSLLFVASVFVFILAQVVSAKLAANGSVSALFLFLVFVLTIVGMNPRRSGGWGRWILRHAAPGLLVLLGCGVSWASFSLTFQGLVQTLNTGGSITLSSPSGVVVDASGNVYVVDTGNNRIVEVSAQGVASVLAITGLSPALSAPNGIAIDGSGNLYVADAGNNRVVEITAAGAGSAISTGSVNLSAPKGVALDQSGDIFVGDTGNSRIVEITSGGPAAALSITVSSGSSTLNSPIGLAVGVTGTLYIADSNNNRIVTVAAGSTTGVVASILGGVTLSSPRAVTVDRMGNVFIADTGNSRIAEIDTSSNGTVLYTNSITLNGPLGVALDVFGTVYIADTGNSRGLVVDPPVNGDLGVGDPTYSLNKTAVGFGHVQLGSSTGVTLTLPFTTGSTALGSVQVLTAGVASLDFIAAPGGTCAGSAGSSGCSGTTCDGSTGASTYCSVEITFLPTAPGLRMGSVVLLDGSNNPILTIPLYAWADAPVVALSPSIGTVINTGGLVLSDPFQVALDGAGNIYIGNYLASNVIKIPAGGGSAAVVPLGTPGGTAVQSVTGVAIDGAGNLFIGDHINSRIVVVTPGGVVSVLTINGLSPAIELPTALAFDAAGNLYIADYGGGRVVRISTLVVAGSTSSGLGTAIVAGAFTFGVSTLSGVTVDAQGNIYIAARTQNSSSIIKVTAAGVASALSFPGITPAISGPEGVAVDAMGNIYVVDSGNSRIVRLTAAGVASALVISGLLAPATLSSSVFGVTLDPTGNLYIPDWTNNRIVKVNVAASALAFPNTTVGATSFAKTTTVTNLGDQALLFALDPTYTADFSQPTGATSPCLLATSLTAGTFCNVSVQFTPQSGAALTAGIVLTNDSLNVSGNTETVSVSGTGIAPPDTTAVTVSTNPTVVVLGQPISITAIVTDTTSGHTATLPTGGVKFTDTLGSTVVSLNGGTAVTLSSGVAILSAVTLSGAGLHTITANYQGVTGSFATSTNTTTIQATAGLVTPTITWIAPGGVFTYGTSLAGILNATAVNGLTPVPGTFTYTATLLGGSPIAVTGATVLGAGSYTLIATFTPTDPSTFASATGSISLTVAKAAIGLALTSAANPAVVGAATTFTATASSEVGSPTGSVSFYDGTTLLGSGTLGLGVAVYSTSGLAVGTHSITAVYAGDNNFSTLTSSALTETITLVVTGITVTATPNPQYDGQPATLTASVAPAPTGSPAGIVSFYSGATLLGTGTLDASGVATFTTSALVVGDDSMTAVYPGNDGFAAATSLAITITVTPAYTVVGPIPPVPVAPGGSVDINITVPPLGGSFDNVVTLSATGLPPGATATFNPPTVTPGSEGAPTVMTIQLGTVASNFPWRGIPINPGGFPIAPVSLAFVFLGTVIGRKRIPRKFVLAMALAGTAFTAALLTGCGGGFAPPAQSGVFTVTVIGTSGTFQASTTVTLTVN
jgi:sugar lactone lactonase YvrE